jgi:hypothetical protein
MDTTALLASIVACLFGSGGAEAEDGQVLPVAAE